MAIRNWFALRAIKKNVKGKKRQFRPLNINEMNKVGIVYLANSEDQHNKVKNYLDKLTKDIGVRSVIALGVVDDKELPGYLVAKRNFTHICAKDLDWKRTPRGAEVVNFITEEFDVLIDLSLEDDLVVQHIVATSRSSFKVGRKGGLNDELHDMLIDVAGNKSISQYINHIDRYLHMINAKGVTV